MKKNVTEIIYENDGSSTQTTPENLKEYIAWLNEKLHSIPEQFRDSAEVKIEVFTSDDCGELEYQITYTRPETDAEEKDREDKEKARLDRISLNELETFNRLRVKFESYGKEKQED